MQPRSKFSLVLSLLTVFASAGCDVLGTGSDETLSLSFSVPRPGGGAGGASAALIPISDSTHTIELQSVELTIDRIVIEEVGRNFDDSSTGNSHGKRSGPGGMKLRAGAVTVDLPLTGGVITPINARLPDGSYDEIKLDISHVRARGTIDGEEFDLTVMVRVGLKLELDPVFVVDSEDDRLNITVTVDPTTWFFDARGRLIDPRAVQLDGALRRSLEHTIRASFRTEDNGRHHRRGHK